MATKTKIINRNRLIRSRTTGVILIGIMAFLVFGILFIAPDEPTQIQIQADDPATPEDEEIVLDIPTIDQIIGLEVPIPEFEPREISITPVITTTDDNGVADVMRGETSFLQALTGFTITQVGDPDKTFDNGRLKIEIEVDVQNPEATNRISTDHLLFTVFNDDLTTKALTVGIPTGGNLVNGTFLAKLFDARIDQIVKEDGESKFDFILERFNVAFLPESIDTIPFSLIITPDFGLVNATQIYSVTFNQSPTEIIIETQEVNGTDIVIVEEVIEDIPNVPCLDVKFDSVSFLSPTVEVSGTNNFFTGTPEGLDQTHIDVRNNRNCDLDIALGSKWVSTTGEVFISDLEDITILTNATIPFKSILFDSTDGCAGFKCAGLKVTSCFIGQVSTTNPIEIIDQLCGNKFFR